MSKEHYNECRSFSTHIANNLLARFPEIILTHFQIDLTFVYQRLYKKNTKLNEKIKMLNYTFFVLLALVNFKMADKYPIDLKERRSVVQ